MDKSSRGSKNYKKSNITTNKEVKVVYWEVKNYKEVKDYKVVRITRTKVKDYKDVKNYKVVKDY